MKTKIVFATSYTHVSFSFWFFFVAVITSAEHRCNVFESYVYLCSPVIYLNDKIRNSYSPR